LARIKIKPKNAQLAKQFYDEYSQYQKSEIPYYERRQAELDENDRKTREYFAKKIEKTWAERKKEHGKVMPAPKYEVPEYEPQEFKMPEFTVPKFDMGKEVSGGLPIQTESKPFPDIDSVKKAAEMYAERNRQAKEQWEQMKKREAQEAEERRRIKEYRAATVNSVANNNQKLYIENRSVSYKPAGTTGNYGSGYSDTAPVRQPNYQINYQQPAPKKPFHFKAIRLPSKKAKLQKQVYTTPSLPKLKMPKKWTPPHAPRPRVRKTMKMPKYY